MHLHETVIIDIQGIVKLLPYYYRQILLINYIFQQISAYKFYKIQHLFMIVHWGGYSHAGKGLLSYYSHVDK